MRPHLSRLGLAAGVLGCALTLAACGGSSDSDSGSDAETVSVDVGTDEAVELSSGPLKVGLFMNAQSNQWQQTFVSHAKDQAESYGWEATVIDSNYDQQAMSDAMLSAATNHTYDAWIVVPIDGVGICKMVTETAPKADIVVTVAGNTVCGRDNEATDDMWSPGTYSYHALAPSPEYMRVWFEQVAALNPGDQTVAMVTGPAANGATIVTQAIAKEFEAAHPEFDVVDFINTDYTAPNAFTETQAYLQGHPDTTIVMSVYSPDISQGVVQALKSLGKDGEIKMSDLGGSEFTAEQIKAGVIQLTMPYYPATQAENAMIAIKDAQDGKEPPQRIYDEIPGGLDNALVITEDNVDDFEPQY